MNVGTKILNKTWPSLFNMKMWKTYIMNNIQEYFNNRRAMNIFYHSILLKERKWPIHIEK